MKRKKKLEKVRQIDAAYRDKMKEKSRKRVAERMADAREDGLATKLSESEPQNKESIMLNL